MRLTQSDCILIAAPKISSILVEREMCSALERLAAQSKF
jgi:hypothetical protein